MDDLLKLIAAEGLYRIVSERMLRTGLFLSRADFGRMQFPIVVGVDQVLALLMAGYDVPLANALIPRTDQLVAPDHDHKFGRGQ